MTQTNTATPAKPAKQEYRPDDLLNTKEATAQEGGPMPYTYSTLKVSRKTGQLGGVAAPVHHKIGGKVFYRYADLQAWLSQFTSVGI